MGVNAFFNFIDLDKFKKQLTIGLESYLSNEEFKNYLGELGIKLSVEENKKAISSLSKGKSNFSLTDITPSQWDKILSECNNQNLRGKPEGFILTSTLEEGNQIRGLIARRLPTTRFYWELGKLFFKKRLVYYLLCMVSLFMGIALFRNPGFFFASMLPLAIIFFARLIQYLKLASPQVSPQKEASSMDTYAVLTEFLHHVVNFEYQRARIRPDISEEAKLINGNRTLFIGECFKEIAHVKNTPLIKEDLYEYTLMEEGRYWFFRRKGDVLYGLNLHLVDPRKWLNRVRLSPKEFKQLPNLTDNEKGVIKGIKGLNDLMNYGVRKKYALIISITV